MDHLPDFVRLGKWHSTYDSGNAPLMFDVCSAVNKAGGLFTDHIVPADAHRTATFFDTWKARAMQADGVIVCFTDEYRQNFTALLKQEARVVLGLHHAKRIRLFVLDPSAGHTAAYVGAHVQAGATTMGTTRDWVKFVQAGGDQLQSLYPRRHGSLQQ